jgi:hypothetical protein
MVGSSNIAYANPSPVTPLPPSPVVAVDANGNASLAWQTWAAGNMEQLYASSLTQGAWSTPALIATTNIAYANPSPVTPLPLLPAIAVDATRSFAVWQQWATGNVVEAHASIGSTCGR